MSKMFFLPFIAIAGIAVAGVDYVNQSRVTGLALGTMGVGTYVSSIGERYLWQRQTMVAAAERAALRQAPMRQHLPETLAGWEMREWNPEDRAQLFPTEDPAASLPKELREERTMSALLAADARIGEERERNEIRFYQKGDSLIALRLTLVTSGGIGLNPVSGMAMNMVNGNIEAMSGKEGFAVVQGVAFRRELGLFGGMTETGEEPSVRIFTAQMGADLRLSLRARAADQDIKELLAAIDFDRLNAILTEPLPNVGKNAPALAPEDEQAKADQLVAAESAAVIGKGRASEAALIAAGQALNPKRQANDAPVPAAASPAGGLLGGLMGMFSKSSDPAPQAGAEAEAAPADSGKPAIGLTQQGCVRRAGIRVCAEGG